MVLLFFCDFWGCGSNFYFFCYGYGLIVDFVKVSGKIGVKMFVSCFYFCNYWKSFEDIVCFFLKFNSEIWYVGEVWVGVDEGYDKIKVSNGF